MSLHRIVLGKGFYRLFVLFCRLIMDSSSSDSDIVESCTDSTDSSSSEIEERSSDIINSRKRRRNVKRFNYLLGKSRKVYKLDESIMSDVSMVGSVHLVPLAFHILLKDLSS